MIKRLFFALWPDDSARAAIVAAQTAGLGDNPARRVKPENLHLTLAFLGEVETYRVDAAVAAAEPVIAPGFTVRFEQVNYWRGPRIICLTPQSTPDGLALLAGQLAQNLRAAGFAIEERPFLAHVSLARNAPALPVASRLELPVTWSAKSFVLVESRPHSQGADYFVLRSWPLAG
jgi:2'-5' RNA ligase